MTLTPGSRFGSFEVISLLGTGGMGEVFRARDPKLGREIAIKVLRDESSPDRLKRFLREARAASALNHPNIVTVHDVGEVDASHYIVMELVSGRTLREALAAGPLPSRDLFKLSVQVADGLAKAHEAGIVHRDLKPENLMITGDGLVKILDFGLAKLLPTSVTDSDMATMDRASTASGVIVGTAPYMSPEQARGEELDFRSDQFSLGSILYEASTGVRAFERRGFIPTLTAIIEREPKPLATLSPDLPKQFVSIVERLLSKTPGRRYASTRDLAIDLEDAADFEPGPLDRSLADAEMATEDRAPAVSKTPSGALSGGERREATIVISSLTGHEGLVEELDPELVAKWTSRFHNAIETIATTHGGIVNHVGEDEAVLLFGIPTNHEDDSRRAVRAAALVHEAVRELSSELPSEVSESLRARTGIATGSVVSQAASESTKYRVTGATVQAAGQLLAHADEDEILVSPATERQIAPFFEMTIAEPLALMRGAGLITPYRVVRETGVRTRIEAAAKVGLTSYTGRDQELSVLMICLEKARQGEGQMVTVAGEAGAGKSRLLYEFRRRLEPEPVKIVEGRCQSYGEGTPYLPFVEALRDVLDLETEDAEEVVSRIQEIDPGLEDLVPLYLYLLSIRSERYSLPEHLKGEDFRLATVKGLAAIFTQESRRQSTVMLLEDWHWADAASQDVLRELAGMASAFPFLIVMSCRPDYGFEGIPEHHYTPVRLGPLDSSPSIDIARAVLGAERLPEDLGRLIHERTAGNPFFIEEVSRALLEDGTVEVEDGKVLLAKSLTELQLPGTVQAVIRARMDRLEDDARELMRVASVIGREFSGPLLKRTVPEASDLDPSLEKLKGLGLVQQIRVFPETTYRFKHALTENVAYESLLRHQRKKLHSVVGEAIEELYPQRIEEQLDVLAQHFSRAEKWQKAVHYGRESSRRTAALNRPAEALSTLERAVEWISNLSEDDVTSSTRLDMLMEAERLCDTLGQRQKQQRLIEELQALLTSGEDRYRLTDLHIRQGDFHTVTGHHELAEQSYEKAIELARADSSKSLESKTLRSLGFLRWNQERFGDAIERNEKALAIDKELGDNEACHGDLMNLCTVLRSSGEFERVLDYCDEALRLNETIGNPVHEKNLVWQKGRSHHHLGNTEEASALYRRAIEIAKRLRLFGQMPIDLESLAGLLWQQGDVEESLERYAESIRWSRETRNQPALARALQILGEMEQSLGRLESASTRFLECSTIYRELGDNASAIDALEAMARVDRDRAREHLEQARVLARKTGDAAKESHLLNSLGIAKWNEDDFEGALESYRKALRILREQGDATHLGLILNSIGVTLSKLERTEEALTELQEAVKVTREADQPLLEGHAHAAMGDVYKQSGKLEEALESYEASLEIRRSIGDSKGQGWMHQRLADLYLSQGLPDLARDSASRASTIARAEKDPKLAEACGRLEERLRSKGTKEEKDA